ncbi:hypothetical protein PG987_016096 [Apiospora arundinis]
MAGTSESSSSSDGHGSSSSSSSFKLLCQYLNFGDDARSRNQVYLTLRSAHIRPFFEEYARDYLMETEYVEDIELESLLAWCKRKDAFRAKKYTSSLSTTTTSRSTNKGNSRHPSASVSSAGAKKQSWSALRPRLPFRRPGLAVQLEAPRRVLVTRSLRSRECWRQRLRGWN